MGVGLDSSYWSLPGPTFEEHTSGGPLQPLSPSVTCSCLHGPAPPSRHGTQGPGGQLARHAAYRNGGALLLVVVCFPLGFHLLPFPQPWTGQIWDALCLGPVSQPQNEGHGNLQGALAISGSWWLVLCLHAGCLRPALCGVCPQDGPVHRRHRLAPWLRLCDSRERAVLTRRLCAVEREGLFSQFCLQPGRLAKVPPGPVCAAQGSASHRTVSVST